MTKCEQCLHNGVCLMQNECVDIEAQIEEFGCGDFRDKRDCLYLPCKLGSTIYKVVADKRVKHPYACEVVGFWYSKDPARSEIHLVHYVNGMFDCSFSVPFSEMGTSIFLTEEEAKKMQKERLHN